MAFYNKTYINPGIFHYLLTGVYCAFYSFYCAFINLLLAISILCI